MVSKEDVEVTHVDQQRINSFATWNLKFKDYIAEFDLKKKEMANLDDAEDELIVSESDSHPYLIGETFFHLSAADVNCEIATRKEQIRMRMSDLDGLISDSKAHMTSLKKDLYAKFGNHINLEED